MRIGLLTIATGKYVQLLPDLAASARRHFFRGHEVTHFVFTDSELGLADAVRVPVRHEPWPLVTLKRFHYFSTAADRLALMDYLFYLDVDMRIERPCGKDMLPNSASGLVGVRHPGFVRPRPWYLARTLRSLPHDALPFERDPRSLACIDDPRHCIYYIGAVSGGRSAAYLQMSAQLRAAVDDDLRRGIIAVWHDESHLNRYFMEHPPRTLPPTYCLPESGHPFVSHLKPVIVARDKDHADLRT